jgi:hypothetical protein
VGNKARKLIQKNATPQAPIIKKYLSIKFFQSIFFKTGRQTIISSPAYSRTKNGTSSVADL